MSRLLDQVRRAALKWPVMLLLTLGLGLPPLRHLGLGFMAGQYIRTAVVLSFALSLLQVRRSLLPLTLGLFFMLQAILFPFGKGLFPQSLNALRVIQLWTGGADVAPALFGELLCGQFSLYLTLICCLIAAMDDELYPAVFCVAALLTLEWLLGVHGQSRYMLLTLPALMLHYGVTHLHETSAPEGPKRHVSPAAIPVLFALLLLSALLAPQDGTVVDSFAAAAQKIRDFVNDNFFFDEERARYSVSSDGWMPEGERQLGGPVTPNESLIMTVNASEPVYLRGSILDTYTGAAWYDALSANRYHYLAPQYRSLREELMQTSYPLISQQNEKSLTVTLQSGSASSLFTPQRVRELSLGENMVAYFNAASELFITRNLSPGDSYAVRYLSMKATDSGMAALVSQNAQASDPYYAQACAQYLSLPSHIQREIYDIAQRVTANCTTPWEKAVALRDYLKYTYPYDLNVEAPPEGIDFVAWFLLAERRGYCTYFASAMTVLCRIAGLPARYVEGYLARPDGTGTAYVYGTDAHAWTEVYMNGAGWITFDATASLGETDHSQENNQNDLPGENEPPTPPPAATPTPSPTPESNETPSPMPSSEPPTEDEQPSPSPIPSRPPQQEDQDQTFSADDDTPHLPWLILLLLLLLTLYLAWRIYETDPIRAAERARNDGQALIVLWEAALSCAAHAGLKRHSHETPLQFATRVEDSLGIPLYGIAEAVSALQYGRHAPPGDILPRARESYLALHEQMSPWRKLRFSLGRALRFSRL